MAARRHTSSSHWTKCSIVERRALSRGWTKHGRSHAPGWPFVPAPAPGMFQVTRGRSSTRAHARSALAQAGRSSRLPPGTGHLAPGTRPPGTRDVPSDAWALHPPGLMLGLALAVFQTARLRLVVLHLEPGTFQASGYDPRARPRGAGRPSAAASRPRRPTGRLTRRRRHEQRNRRSRPTSAGGGVASNSSDAAGSTPTSALEDRARINRGGRTPRRSGNRPCRGRGRARRGALPRRRVDRAGSDPSPRPRPPA